MRVQITLSVGDRAGSGPLIDETDAGSARDFRAPYYNRRVAFLQHCAKIRRLLRFKKYLESTRWDTVETVYILVKVLLT